MNKFKQRFNKVVEENYDTILVGCTLLAAAGAVFTTAKYLGGNQKVRLILKDVEIMALEAEVADATMRLAKQRYFRLFDAVARGDQFHYDQVLDKLTNVSIQGPVTVA
jgi:hypothetical protein